MIQDVLSYLGENFSKELSSNATGTRIHQYIKKETGCYDPYCEQKKEGNEIALSLVPKVREILKEDNSLETYVKIAIVGNILDFGTFGLDTEFESMITEGLRKELVINKIDEFEEALRKYDKVLYLVDNTGEIVFDKFLPGHGRKIQQLMIFGAKGITAVIIYFLIAILLKMEEANFWIKKFKGRLGKGTKKTAS